jgi:ribosomal-protein-alanine N-acetyltransferase
MGFSLGGIMNSERLLFRTWEIKDIDKALALWGDPLVMTFIGKGGLSREQAEARLLSEISCQEKNKVQYWPIFQKTDNQFIGCCGLKPWVHSAKGGHELGFHIVQTAWGKGFAQEAAGEVVRFAKAQRMSHLMAGHHPENRNSKKILERLGFEFVEKVFYPPTGLMHPSYVLPLQSKV